MFTPSQSGFVAPQSPSPNLQTLLEYCDALNERDYDRVIAVFDETLEHRILPKSLGRPVLNKAQYSAYIAGIIPLFKRLHITLHEIVEAGDIITVHATSTGESATGVPYVNESMLIMHFVPPKKDGVGLPKISFVKEYVDSSTVLKFFTEERAKAAKLAARAGTTA